MSFEENTVISILSQDQTKLSEKTRAVFYLMTPYQLREIKM